MAFEYNGIQHYQPIEWFGGQETFDRIVSNDLLKINLCNKNNVKLIIIKQFPNPRDKKNCLDLLIEAIGVAGIPVPENIHEFYRKECES